MRTRFVIGVLCAFAVASASAQEKEVCAGRTESVPAKMPVATMSLAEPIYRDGPLLSIRSSRSVSSISAPG